MSNLAALIDRVEVQIEDETNAQFSTTRITEGIRQALHYYSKKRPLQAITTLNIASDSRELSVSSITGLLDVSEVWCPYTAANPEDPPLIRGFEFWPDQATIYFPYEVNGGWRPVAGDVARVFYHKLHTITNLDSGTADTLPVDDETALVSGAAGYTVIARARAATEKVMLDDQVPISKQLLDWAARKIKDFEMALEGTEQRERSGVAWVQMPPLDRWDGGWQ